MTTASPSFSFSGVVTPLAKKTVAATTSFSATLAAISGVNSVAWSIIATDESTLPANYTLVTSGVKGSIVTLTSLALGTAALLQCTVNSGVDPQTGSVSTAMTATAMFEVLLANGGSVGVVGETTQRSGTFGSLVFLNGVARLVNTIAGSTVTSITAGTGIAVTGTVAVPIVSATASSGAVPGTMSTADFTKLGGIGTGATVASIGAGTATTVGGTAAIPTVNVTPSSAVVPGSMTAAHYSLLAGAVSVPTASTIVQRDGAGGAAFATVTATALNVETITVGGGGTGAAIYACAVSQRPFAETYAANVVMRGIDGGQHNITLTGNITFGTPTNYSYSPVLKMFIRQGGAGSYTGTWTAGVGGFYFPTAYTGTLIATAVGDADYFEFVHSTLPTSHWLCINHLKYTTP